MGIIKPYLVEQNRMMGNAQLLGYGFEYGSKHLGQNFFFYWIKKDRSLPEEPERVILKQTPPYNLVFSHFSRFHQQRLSNGYIET
jgi:hypothetical protein